MIFVFNSICIALLFILKNKTKILCFILFSLLLAIWGIIYMPKELKEPWFLEVSAFLALLAAYIIILLGIIWGRAVVLFFNPQGFKYENIIRNVYTYIFTGFILFVSYLFFIKGVIYD